MAKHGKIPVVAKARTKRKHTRRRKKKFKRSSMQGRKSEAQDLEHQDFEQHDSTLMSQHNNKRKGKGIALPQSEDLILQPPSMAILEEDHMQILMIPTPPNIVRRELHDTDSERTISTGPSTSNSHMAQVIVIALH
ncbi:PREDICTED: uncharacterized protein LOC109179940 [Ipomoea nil]|uniref:uncharacterized protein LOC109179940 n=1 Tax=Ipomoea nil TaxID=35883 RepID=UPI000900CF9A|nr:PREDICTED: uncharacterized protein LOC109179940 [Ipomoea nil]